MDDVQSATNVGGEEDQSLDTTQQDAAGLGQDGGDNAESKQQVDVPESYEFAMPDGVELDETLAGDANLAFKEAGLSQTQADQVTNLFVNYQQRQVDQFNQQKEDWATASRNDKEFGGERFEENLSIANTYFKTLPEGLKSVLVNYGLNNHPDVIREMLKHGRTLKEDRPGNGQAPNPVMSRIEKLYGS